jgi:amino acid transporter
MRCQQPHHQGKDVCEVAEVMLNSFFLPCLRLWSIGVGSVIGGDFFGWNSTLHGGFGASLVALLINATMFGILAHCTAKLSSRVPKGGAYKFVEVGIGPKTSLFVAGLELVKLFWVLSALCFGLTDYLRLLFGFSSQFQFLCYPLLFSVFSFLGMLGIRTSGNIQIVITCGCLLVLSFYWISMSTILKFNTNAIPDHNWFNSWRSTLISIPYGSWLFLGFEELPLIQIEENPQDNSSPGLVTHFLPNSSPESISPSISSPYKPSSKSHNSKIMFHGILSSFLTVFISGALTVTLASGSRPGVDRLKEKTSPLLSGIEEVYGDESPIAILFNILSVLALFAPCYSFMLYCSEHIQVGSLNNLFNP